MGRSATARVAYAGSATARDPSRLHHAITPAVGGGTRMTDTGALAERRISGKAFIGHYVLAVAAGAVIAVICFVTGNGIWAPLGILPILGVLGYATLMRLN